MWDGSADGIQLDPVARGALDTAVALCEQLGHHVEEALPPVRRGDLGNAQGVITAAHTAALLTRRSTEAGRSPGEDDLEPVAAWMAERARGMTATDYAEALRTTHRIGRLMGQYHASGIDLMLTPTLAAVPPPLGELVATKSTVAEWGARQGAYSPFCALANATGQPAMSVPLYYDQRGLTVGSHFIAPYGGEAVLLQLAAQMEKAQPFWPQPR